MHLQVFLKLKKPQKLSFLGKNIKKTENPKKPKNPKNPQTPTPPKKKPTGRFFF